MDSPEVTKTASTPSAATETAAAASSIGSPIVQESPFSNYLSNLSPIKPVKNSRILPGYADLSSPPLVFTSPHIVSKCEASSLQRPQCPQKSGPETPKDNVGISSVDVPPGLEKCDSYLSSKFNVDSEKDGDHSSYTKEQHCSPSGVVDEYLSEPVDTECTDCVHSANPITETEPSIGPRGLANLQTIVLNADTDKEAPTFALPTSGQGSSNCVLSSDGLLYETLSVQNLHANEDYYDHVEAGLDDPGVSQLYRGMSRRCLQFEEAQGIGQGSVPAMNSPNSSSDPMGLRLPFSSAGMENSKILNPGIAAPSGKRTMINLTRGLISNRSPNHNSNARLSIPKRSGIGLHLNSIVKALPMECNVNESMKTHLSENEKCSTQLSNSVEKITHAEEKMLENQVVPAVVSATSDSLLTMKSVSALQSLEPNETPPKKRTLSLEQCENYNELNQSSPKKRRKKFTPDGDGCKRCNCKKTKCLKLYCDCFAAGIYCADSCSCQGCFNRPEHEDKVLETRQLIESRNPLAFAPKIVHQASGVPAVIGEEVNRTTPASARHKRGCNCKRSMCLKKYCECYQSNVGCSSGCRCEGCKNVFGRREDYTIVEEIMSSTTSKDGPNDIADEKLAGVDHSNDLFHADSSELESPAPFTPQCQFSEHGNDAPKSGPFSTRYLPSPLSHMSTIQSDSKTSSPTQTGDSLLAEIDCRDMEFTIAEMIGELSPKLDPISGICYLSPQRTASSSAVAASPSASKTKDLSTNVPRPQFEVGSGGTHMSSSIRWHGLPVTPMPSLGAGKMIEDVLMEEEDTTPEILKEACNPIQSVKATSPNKKRISPPHAHSKRLELGSIVSGGLKSGRKFILKAVPSFPPLTPCLDSKATKLPPTRKSNSQQQGK
ncbi:unnamed protein product [Linum tenue]|uniref:CRC domain-containing protein n=1 Tax=Linum tenue TaxID=586396 RepID=A0AAV0K6R7_9ROSI|nr:unnamed protein product [Linum tenue]